MADNIVPIDEKKAKANQKAAKLPSKKDLSALADRLVRLKGKQQTANQDVAEAMREAVDNKGVHKAAMALAVKLQRQTPDKANAFLQHFDHYREALELDRDELPLTGDTKEG